LENEKIGNVMGGSRRFDHACISVSDLENSIQFYVKSLGLSILKSDENTTYLGCGADEHFDLVLKRGKPQLEHIALRMDTEDELARIERNLERSSVAYKTPKEKEPGLKTSIAFKIPSGLLLELVMMEDSDYYRPTKSRRLQEENSRVSPLIDADHIGIYTALVQKDCEFFRDVIGMSVSEVRVGDDGTWRMAFARLGNNHHDIAFFYSDQYRLSHYAWNLENMASMVMLMDRLARNKTELEIAPYRHYIGSNISCYFRGPDNIRIEYCTEMATLDDNTPTSFWKEGYPKHSAWGGITVHPSFWVGI
jgi:catechol 2,3-dioxygenase